MVMEWNYQQCMQTKVHRNKKKEVKEKIAA
jgi:hypothetical protein